MAGKEKMRSGLGRLVFFVFWNTALFVHWLIWLWYLILPGITIATLAKF